MKPRILLTNDDGVTAAGLRSLREALSSLGLVQVVAPEGEQSGTSHALTIRRPLRIQRPQPNVISVDGTPTDCVHLALHRLLDWRPDLVVSGINLGSNLGDDVTYSGTVAAALEASLHRVPAFAISLTADGDNDFGHAARYARRLAERILATGLPPGTFLNVNVPPGSPVGVRWTRQGRRRHGDPGAASNDDGPDIWIRRHTSPWEPDPKADVEAIRAGSISITPLRDNWTDGDPGAGGGVVATLDLPATE